MVVVAGDSPAPEVMAIGHEAVSFTFMPEIAASSAFTFVDCPGFTDNRGAEINISNAVNTRAMLAQAAGVRVLVLLNYNSLLADRGKGIKELAGIFVSLFGDSERLLRSVGSVLLGISRCPKVDGEGDPVELDQLKVKVVFISHLSALFALSKI